MAVFTLEDLQGSVEVMVFPKTMASIGHLLSDDSVVLVQVAASDGGATLRVVEQIDRIVRTIDRLLDFSRPKPAAGRPPISWTSSGR